MYNIKFNAGYIVSEFPTLSESVTKKISVSLYMYNMKKKKKFFL